MFLLYLLSDVLNIFRSSTLRFDFQACSMHIDMGLGETSISIAAGVPDPIRASQGALTPNGRIRTILTETLLIRTGSNQTLRQGTGWEDF
jgi:hypothetical protein